MTAQMWLQNLAAYSLQVAALILAGAGLVCLFRLKAPAVLLAYWQVLLLACLVLPVIQPWRVTRLAPPAAAAPSGLTSVPLLPESESIWPSAASLPAPPAQILTYRTVVDVLAVGVLLRFAWLLLGVLRLRRYRNRARLPGVLPEVIREAQWQVGATPDIYFSREIDTPVTFGFIRPAVLFPESFIEMDRIHQRPVACHELLHVQRRDWLYIVFEEVLRSVLWFHPAIWWALNRIHLSREQVVDREVLRITRERGHYLESLLQIASLRGRPAAVPAPLLLRERHLVQRVALMLKESKMTKSRLIFSIVPIAAILLWTGTFAAGVFPLTGSPRFEAPAPAPAPVRLQPQQPIRVDTGIMAAKLIRKVMPAYPELAKRARVQQVVSLDVITSADGSVAEVRVLRGHPLLDQAAIDAVKQWRYSTTLLNGAAVPVETTVNVEFKLPNETAGVAGGVSSGVIGGVVGGLLVGVVSGGSPQSTNPAVLPPRMEPMRVGGNVQETKIISKVMPVYPELAKRARVEAMVILEVTINEQGEVYGVRVQRSHPLLEQAAIDAVRQWRYQPTLLNGQPVPVVTTVTVEFSLASSFTLDADGILKDQQGQPVTVQQLKESEGIPRITPNPQVTFANLQSTLNYLQYQGIQNVRINSSTYTYYGGRLYYNGPVIISTAEGLRTSSTNPDVQSPVIDFDVNRLAALAKSSGALSTLPATAHLTMACILYLDDAGQIVDVQGVAPYDLPEVLSALRQARVSSPARKDGVPVPAAVRLTITIQ